MAERVKLTEAVYDKTGREIMAGDILKVLHFIGHRRKRYYMYKQVIEERVLKSGHVYWSISHLMGPDEGGYLLAKDGKVHDDYEIVQGLDVNFEDRPRIGRQALKDQEPHHG